MTQRWPSLDDHLHLKANKNHVSLLLLLSLPATFDTVDHILLRCVEAEVDVRFCLGLVQIASCRLDLKRYCWRPATLSEGTILWGSIGHNLNPPPHVIQPSCKALRRIWHWTSSMCE